MKVSCSELSQFLNLSVERGSAACSNFPYQGAFEVKWKRLGMGMLVRHRPNVAVFLDREPRRLSELAAFRAELATWTLFGQVCYATRCGLRQSALRAKLLRAANLCSATLATAERLKWRLVFNAIHVY
jgi:hypothetical protein